jgi:hypothetical protein
MPEKHPGNLIGGSLHVKNHPHALTLPGIGPSKLQYNGGGKVAVPQIGKTVVLSDIDHAPEILNEVPVGIVGSCLVEKCPSVRIGVEDNLQSVNHRGFAAAGMAGEKIDPLVKGQYFMPYIVPVIQADSGQRLKSLIRHIPHPPPCKSRSAPAHHPP